MDGDGSATGGAPPGRGPPGRRARTRRRAVAVAGIAAVAAVLVAGALQGRGAPAADAAAPAPVAAPADVPLDSLPESATPVRVSELGPLLPVPAGWELFATGSRTVARIRLASGRVTRTTFPGIDSGGPLSFVAGPDRVLVRPLDYVPGYVVADDQPARPLTAPALGAGLLIPGPDPAHVWTHSGDGQRPWVLTDLDGTPTGPIVDPPAYGLEVTSDGGGALLFTDAYGGAYQASPAGLRRITHGRVLAAGPAGWLTADCDDAHRCSATMVERGSRHTRPVPMAVDTELVLPPGVISPDGAVAAVLTPNTSGRFDLHLVHLDTGAELTVAATFDRRDGEPEAVVWAPDSRSLFTIIDGRPVVVDARTARTRVLDPTLPPMDLLALRVAAP